MCVYIQGVPLATEPSISLIILTPMKILQRNLNRSTFVVRETKRNVSVVCVCSAPNCCDMEQRSANQPERNAGLSSEWDTLYIINNQKNSQTNSYIYTHSIITSNKHHLHRTNANLSCFQKRTFYVGIKIFNSLPNSQTVLKNEKAKFKAAVRKDPNTHSFYPVDEFFMCKDDL